MTGQTDLTLQQKTLLLRETDSAKHLLAYGEWALRHAAFDLTTRDAVLTMLSIGVEKLLKLTLGLTSLADGHGWPPKRVMQNDYRHDVVKLEVVVREGIRRRLPHAIHAVHVERLLVQVDGDPIWPTIAAALRRYAEAGRFYNLDGIAGKVPDDEDPAWYWDKVGEAAQQHYPRLATLFARAVDEPSLFDDFRRASNEAIAASLHRWWELIAMAGIQGVFGDDWKGWGHDLRNTGTQIRLYD